MSKERLCIYIAGPFTAKDLDGIMKNLDNAIRAGNAVIQRGHHPYVPHLTYYMAASDSNPFGHGLEGQNDRRWIDVDAPWVLMCDAIYVMPTAYKWNYDVFSEGERVWLSRGAKHEYEEAVKRGMTVYWSIDDIPKAPDWEGQN
jgi:hypothetical protein